MDDEENSLSMQWVAIVYKDGDKIASKVFNGEEEGARLEASSWVQSQFGDHKNWSLHRIIQPPHVI
tara:strand:+ start:287 stop:484 length:198 start_codon:yes stop_codon:yes gene_type:complete